MKLLRVITLLAMVCLIVGFAIITFINAGECNRLADGYETRYSFLEMKCEMNVNGRWLDVIK